LKALTKWKEILNKQGIRFSENFSLRNCLCETAELQAHLKAELPQDDHCVDNVIMFNQTEKYVLV